MAWSVTETPGPLVVVAVEVSVFRDVSGELGGVGGHQGVTEIFVVHGLRDPRVHSLHHVTDDGGRPLHGLVRGEVGRDDLQTCPSPAEPG